MSGIKHGTVGAAGTTLTATLWNEAHAITGVARAYKGSDQAIVDSTYTKVTLDTETFDPDSKFDVVNNRYVGGVIGYYLVYGQIRYQSIADTVLYEAHIYVNGSSVSSGIHHAGGAVGTYNTVNVSDLIYCSAVTDYIELWTYQVSGGAESVDGQTDGTFLYVVPLSIP